MFSIIQDLPYFLQISLSNSFIHIISSPPIELNSNSSNNIDNNNSNSSSTYKYQTTEMIYSLNDENQKYIKTFYNDIDLNSDKIADTNNNDNNNINRITNMIHMDLLYMPVNTTIIITLHCMKSFINLNYQVTDASYGLLLPPPTYLKTSPTQSLLSLSNEWNHPFINTKLLVDNSNISPSYYNNNMKFHCLDEDLVCQKVNMSESLLTTTSITIILSIPFSSSGHIITMPIIDASMPFNVISLVS